MVILKFYTKTRSLGWSGRIYTGKVVIRWRFSIILFSIGLFYLFYPLWDNCGHVCLWSDRESCPEKRYQTGLEYCISEEGVKLYCSWYLIWDSKHELIDLPIPTDLLDRALWFRTESSILVLCDHSFPLHKRGKKIVYYSIGW